MTLVLQLETLHGQEVFLLKHSSGRMVNRLILNEADICCCCDYERSGIPFSKRSAQSTVQKATRDDLLMNHMGGNDVVREPDAMVRAPEFESRSHDYLNLGNGNPSIQPRPVYNRLVSLLPVGILNRFFISNFVSVACLQTTRV